MFKLFTSLRLMTTVHLDKLKKLAVFLGTPRYSYVLLGTPWYSMILLYFRPWQYVVSPLPKSHFVNSHFPRTSNWSFKGIIHIYHSHVYKEESNYTNDNWPWFSLLRNYLSDQILISTISKWSVHDRRDRKLSSSERVYIQDELLYRCIFHEKFHHMVISHIM